MKRVNIILDESDLKKLQDAHINVSSLVRDLIKKYLNKKTNNKYAQDVVAMWSVFKEKQIDMMPTESTMKMAIEAFLTCNCDQDYRAICKEKIYTMEFSHEKNI